MVIRKPDRSCSELQSASISAVSIHVEDEIFVATALNKPTLALKVRAALVVELDQVRHVLASGVAGYRGRRGCAVADDTSAIDVSALCAGERGHSCCRDRP